MERKRKMPKEKKSGKDRNANNENWQINPLAGYKESENNTKDKIEKKKEDADGGNRPMGFDEWSVSWP